LGRLRPAAARTSERTFDVVDALLVKLPDSPKLLT
jgi:hypothetical protein